MGASLQRCLHPVIRIAIFIILAGALSLGNFNDLLLATAVVATFYGITGNTHLVPALKMLRRMRWLFLSLFIIYCWFTPGTPLPLSLPAKVLAWLPTLAGMQEAIVRIASLSIIVLAVNLLLQTTSRQQLLGAIHWWIQPLRYAGIAPERLAVRITLALQTVLKVQPLITQALAAHAQGPVLARTGHVAATLYQSVLTHAEHETCHAIEIPPVAAPALWQWVFPAGLGWALWWVS